MNLAETLKNRKVQIALAGVALAIALVLALVWILSPKNAPAASGSASPAASASPSGEAIALGESQAPVASPSTTCMAPAGNGFVPAKYAIEKIGAEADVIALDTDENGNIAAPPKDQPKTASWWDKGPAPASEQGQVVLSIHTYRNGGAVGNDMYSDEGPKLQPGDVLKLWDAQGNLACYEFVKAEKIALEDFDKDSNKLVRIDGDPGLAIIICWDFQKDTEEWNSRVFFHFKPVTA